LPRPTPPPWPRRPGAGETVLFVEDEVAVRGMARRILEKRNYQVVEAADGREALACYAEHDQTIAIVITDLLMPVLDGPSFIRELRRINPSVPVIVTSGNMEGVSFPPEEKARVQAFLTKPYTADELLICLNHALHPLPG
jgi:CheY-like chemotaxis protein